MVTCVPKRIVDGCKFHAHSTRPPTTIKVFRNLWQLENRAVGKNRFVGRVQFPGAISLPTRSPSGCWKLQSAFSFRLSRRSRGLGLRIFPSPAPIPPCSFLNRNSMPFACFLTILSFRASTFCPIDFQPAHFKSQFRRVLKVIVKLQAWCSKHLGRNTADVQTRFLRGTDPSRQQPS